MCYTIKVDGSPSYSTNNTEIINNQMNTIHQYIRRGENNKKIIGCLVAIKDEKTNQVKIGASFLNPKDREEVNLYNKRVKIINAISWERINAGDSPADFPIEKKRKAFDKKMAIKIAGNKAQFDISWLKNTKLKSRELNAFIARSKRYFKDGVFNY